MDPLEQAKQRFFEDRSLLLAGDFAGAERQLREALRLAPDRASVLTNLSAVLLRVRKAAEARAHAERALALDPPNAEAWVNLAGAHAPEYDYSAALECCDKAIALRPSDADACVARAQASTSVSRFRLPLSPSGWREYGRSWARTSPRIRSSTPRASRATSKPPTRRCTSAACKICHRSASSWPSD